MVASGAATPRGVAAREAAARDNPAARVSAWFAGLSVAAGVLGAALVGIGVSALPGPWTQGYVSEGGVAAAGHSTLYRTGIAALAVSMGLLGLALARPATSPRLRRLPAWWPAPWLSLVVASALGLVSSRVSCTRGCPLPPYQRTTFQDLVHAVASIGAVGFTALAMLSIALLAPAGRLRALARVATLLCMPLLVALAVAILAVGRGAVTGVLERVSLVTVLASVVALASTVVVDRRRPPPNRMRVANRADV